MMKKIALLLAIILLLTGCQSNKNPIVTMTIKDYGTIKIELYPHIAPNTVANFVNLIENHFYDNLSFHRLVPGFVLQGGDPNGDGTGGPNYTIKGEFKANGVNNNLSHTTGVISMARAQDYNSAGSQFFIVLSNDAKYSLDGNYAAFGKVISGLEVIEDIEKTAKIADTTTGKLAENITISKVTVETFNQTYKVQKITSLT